jgi:hypothetical protein
MSAISFSSQKTCDAYPCIETHYVIEREDWMKDKALWEPIGRKLGLCEPCSQLTISGNVPEQLRIPERARQGSFLQGFR